MGNKNPKRIIKKAKFFKKAPNSSNQTFGRNSNKPNKGLKKKSKNLSGPLPKWSLN